MAEIIEDLFRRSGNVFGIGFERGAERGEVREAFLLGNGSHLRVNAVDFAETKLVDLVRRHVRRGAGVDVILVTLLAI